METYAIISQYSNEELARDIASFIPEDIEETFMQWNPCTEVWMKHQWQPENFAKANCDYGVYFIWMLPMVKGRSPLCGGSAGNRQTSIRSRKQMRDRMHNGTIKSEGRKISKWYRNESFQLMWVRVMRIPMAIFRTNVNHYTFLARLAKVVFGA
jgi:hypothetical protein